MKWRGEGEHLYISLTAGKVKLEVSITPGAGTFEVCENGTLVVSGTIAVPGEAAMQLPVSERLPEPDDDDLIKLTTSDVYKELQLRGYEYGLDFQGILSATNRGKFCMVLLNQTSGS